jgi:regulator of sigma D
MGMNETEQDGRPGIPGPDIIDKLLAERQRMLVKFCALAGVEPFAPVQPVAAQLQDFCQVLMDYTAFGHFEVLPRIAEDPDAPTQLRAMTEEVYPEIAETTSAAVGFNDKYDASAHVLKLDELPEDLSALGEQIAARIELEDRVLALLVS